MCSSDLQARCDGQQGGRPEPPTFDPFLISGADDATWDTSEAAAAAIADAKDTQRAAVYEAIIASGADGHSDDEIQLLLSLDGSSERPRRWELWKRSHIRIRRDANGHAVRRRTRTGRQAVVWIANHRTGTE